MSDWGWLSRRGNRGELPIQVTSRDNVEILPDYAEGFEVDDHDNLCDSELRRGDVCILTCEVTTVSGDSPSTIDVDIHDIEYVNRPKATDSEIDKMMRHLDRAKDLQQVRRKQNSCGNCDSITSNTQLTVSDDRQDRDLHFCAECGRLLSTDEYERWKDVHNG